jgi:hypothetical protein
MIAQGNEKKQYGTIDFIKKCCCQQPLAIWCNTQEMTKNVSNPNNDACETLVFIYNKEVNALV